MRMSLVGFCVCIDTDYAEIDEPATSDPLM